jgi:hypothetical protein
MKPGYMRFISLQSGGNPFKNMFSAPYPLSGFGIPQRCQADK